MESPARKQAITRTTFLAGGAATWGLAVFGKLLYLQVGKHKYFADLADGQQLEIVDLPAPRGSILDRNGEVFAISEPVDSVYVSPIRLPNLGVAADLLARVLHLDRDQLYAGLRSYRDNRKRRGFFWVKRKITAEEKANILSLKLNWIKLQADTLRHYPQNECGAHVVGSVDFAETGNAGIEMSLDGDLRGEVGSEQMLIDVNKRGIESKDIDAPQAGTNIVLTIDERIQFVAERDLKEAVIKTGARTGTVVVMNPQNGEILAMASYPSFDPNKPAPKADPAKARMNRAVSAPFEPGSVFKVVTLSAALETTNLRPETVMPCGTMKMFHRVIHEAHHAYGPLSMADVLAKSSNVGAIQIGMKVGKEKLYEYVCRFGFGQSTETGLPYESRGRLRKLEHWQPGSICSIPMGHEISVTAMQLARACSVVANGGLLIQPKLILKQQRPGGEMREIKSPPPVRILKPETAFTMRRMMEGVIVLPYGTGHSTARLSGYSAAGKSGSAQIYDFKAKHYTNHYHASFMGFAPVTNPAVVVVVTLNGTTGNAGFGGAAAGPVFRSVAQEALRVLDVPKDIPESTPSVEEDRVNENDTAVADLSDPPELDEQEADFAPQMFGPRPEPASERTGQPQTAAIMGPRAPNFLGMSMRAVVEEAGALGLAVSLDGRGVARVQAPPPGSPLQPGARIRVVFAR